MAEKSILDARLAEIDRRLGTIQSGLAPGPVVAPEAAPVPKRLPDAPDTPDVAVARDVADAADAAAALVSELRALVDAHERLLASSRELLQSSPPAPEPEVSLGLSAGPFASTEALRRFERSLQALPEVRAVTVREYEGADRVIVDVHLAQPTP